MQNIYLSNQPPMEAYKRWTSTFSFEGSTEEVAAWESLGRVTAEAVFAAQCAPNFKSSAMDGIAVQAHTTYGAAEHQPVVLTHGKDFIYIDTGEVLPAPWDAVIMVEHIEKLDAQGKQVEIRQAVAPWKSVRAMGEDMVKGEMIVPSGRCLTPEDVGALLAGGVTQLSVSPQVRVGILPTGTEIHSPWEPATPGSIIDSNSFMFQGLAQQAGAQTTRYAPVDDTPSQLRKAVERAVVENDMVIVNAGSSAGREDYTRQIIQELGTLTAHGVAIKPGKPTVLGTIAGKPVIGTPGYPVAAYVVFQLFVRPVLYRLGGRTPPAPVTTQGILSRRLVSDLKHEDYVPVKLGQVQGKTMVMPVRRGSGITMSLVEAHGFIRIPHNTEGLHRGQSVEVLLKDPTFSMENTVVSIGSHDLLLDLLGDTLREQSAYRLSSAHVGSQGGLMALKQGECHLAPIHLLDEGSGVYNERSIAHYFSQPMALVKGVGRTQGLMVAPGNPKKIEKVEDLAREDVQFVNRQRGSGTRVLLDYLLKQKGISSESISGYHREGITHTAVAAEVFSGSADVGLGVLSAARALGLEFIPIAEEEYDFVCTKETTETPAFSAFIQALKAPAFLAKLDALGGYTFQQIGELKIIGK